MINTALSAAPPWRRTLSAVAAWPVFEPLRATLRDVFAPAEPPARVVAAIKASERVSEILVGWVQLLGVGLFAILYVASHGAFAAQRGIEPVPIALTAYGLFVIWRMRRAYAGARSDRELILSAAADVAVLMITIWSFTLQYDLPPALYLKAPTLLYVFILIALRALRFNGRLVMLTGLFAMGGWLCLVGVAAFGETPAPITRDYPTYMTSLSLLWGAEFDKIISILAVTIVLALAVSRARSLLVKTVIEESAAHELSRFLDPSAARRVRSAARALKPGDGELKPAAIMFLDLRGFSAASAMLAPQEVIGLLQEYQSRFVPIVEDAGGSVDKYLGDGILISFGMADMSGREVAKAFAAVPNILAAADEWARERALKKLAPLAVATAITVGDVVHGVIGYDDRLEFTVIGDAVNVAAKLEKHAKIENARVITTRAALERARAQGATISPLRLANAATVEGVGEPIDLAIIA
jgi:adenylate cyclase